MLPGPRHRNRLTLHDMAYEIKRFPYDGTIDADGHVLEPAWLWEEYLEAALPRPRAAHPRRRRRARVPRARRHGRRAHDRRGSLGLIGRDGRVRGAGRRPSAATWTTSRSAPATRRSASQLLDEREPRQERALPDDRPALGVRGRRTPSSRSPTSAPTTAGSPTSAATRGGRLVPIAHLTLLDPEGSAAELERAVADGCKGGFVAPSRTPARPHGHPDHDALYARGRRRSACRSRSTRRTSRPGRCRCASTACAAARASSSTT